VSGVAIGARMIALRMWVGGTVARSQSVSVAAWLLVVGGCAVPSTAPAPDRVPASPAASVDAGALRDGAAAVPDLSVDAPARAPDGPPGIWRCSPGLGSGLGQPCGCAGECASGICADGVCCNRSCTEACLSCKLPGRMGACTAVAIGAPDPHGVCARDPPETCGRTWPNWASPSEPAQREASKAEMAASCDSRKSSSSIPLSRQ
jgi:hypothetical protein